MNINQESSLIEIEKFCVITDVENGEVKTLKDINDKTYVAMVGSTDDENITLIFIENVDEQERSSYSVKDFMSNVLELCNDVNPSRIKDFVSVNHEMTSAKLDALKPRSDGTVTAFIEGYVEYDNHWAAKNNDAGAHIFIMSAKTENVTLEWVAKERASMINSLVNGKDEILSEAKDDENYRRNPSAYYGVSDSDFSSIRSSTKLKRF